MQQKDDHPDINLWVVVIPDAVYESCKPKSTIKKESVVIHKVLTKGQAKKLLAAPELFEDRNKAAEPFAFEATSQPTQSTIAEIHFAYTDYS